MELLVPINNRQYSWLNHAKESVYTLPNIIISAFTTSDPETWFLPEELHDVDLGDDDDMQVDTGHAGSLFEAEDHYDLPIRQFPPPSYAQPMGAHFEPQHEYQSYQQHNEPEPEYPLDIYTVRLRPCASKATEIQQPFDASRRSKLAPITTYRIFGIIFSLKAVTVLAGLLHLDPVTILPYSHPKY
ncbi:unnamed protein product [Lactuca virosa]|uniref:Uncharacterized protein n=1 Tax=Lactuca virosa TaxID=75947 RepID=A0AAU9P0Y8_9ASTR|nr:unnamed protein product [Lactuca virosa]